MGHLSWICVKKQLAQFVCIDCSRWVCSLSSKLQLKQTQQQQQQTAQPDSRSADACRCCRKSRRRGWWLWGEVKRGEEIRQAYVRCCIDWRKSRETDERRNKERGRRRGSFTFGAFIINKILNFFFANFLLFFSIWIRRCLLLNTLPVYSRFTCPLQVSMCYN